MVVAVARSISTNSNSSGVGDGDNDNDNDTLIEDGSNMCWTSGPAGMSDGSEIGIGVERCRLREVS